MRLAALLLVLIPVAIAIAAPQPVLLVYGEKGCPECIEQLRILEGSGLGHLVYVDIMENVTNAREFFELCTLLGISKFVPLTVLVSEGRAVAVAVRLHSVEALRQLLLQAGEGVLVSEGGRVWRVTDTTTVRKVGEIVKARLAGIPIQVSWEPLTPGKVLPQLLALAVADSVKPCTFIVYASALLMVLAAWGKGKALASAASFIASVYACYYLLGLGLTSAFAHLPPLTVKVLAAAGLAIGAYLFAANIRSSELRSLVPGSLMRKVSGASEQVVFKVAAPAASAAIGALVSFTLVPCSGGPYLVSAALLSRIPDQVSILLLLALYNLVFIAPLAAIATALIAAPSAQNQWLSGRKLAFMQALAGVALAATCAYIIVFMR